MNRYQKGKIYRIVSNHTDMVYIGSTCDPLSKRIAKHRSNYRTYLGGNYHNVTSFDILRHGDGIIVLVEDFPCQNKEQLLARERFHIENTPNCVNRNIPGRIPVEWRADNREINAEKDKARYELNKEAILERNRAYQKAHKAEIYGKRAQLVECECGFTATKSNMSNHRKTKKHGIAMAQLAAQEIE